MYSSPRASCLAASIRQLVYDYAWDIIHDPVTGTVSNRDSVVRSNLVVLFSRCCRSFKCLSEFLNVGVDDECLVNVNAFCHVLCGLFKNVNGVFLTFLGGIFNLVGLMLGMEWSVVSRS